MESSEDSRTTTRMNNRGGEWASSSSSSTCASVRVTWSSGTKLAAAGDSGAGCGPCSSWEWQALVPGCSSDDDDDEEMMMARAFAGISVSNFLKGGKGRRGKDKHSAQSGWPLLQQMFGHVVGARSRASSLVKQVLISCATP